ncbi:hypothetical protein [Litoreibacter halocynthiae]|uniref:hypothetical protein n=1 Tax=Litoreibacter halocynthiae TaxID=1242689 RepID=UPI00248FB828|nr:hypothetical protein [Litoreibacter halocynthiae]
MYQLKNTKFLTVALVLLASPTAAFDLGGGGLGGAVGGVSGGVTEAASASVGGIGSATESASGSVGGSDSVASVSETGSVSVGAGAVATETVNATIGNGTTPTNVTAEVCVGGASCSQQAIQQAPVARLATRVRSGGQAKKLVTLVPSDLVGMEVVARGNKAVGVVKAVNSFDKRYVDVTIALDAALFDEMAEIRMKLPMSNVSSNGISLNTSVRKIRRSL